MSDPMSRLNVALEGRYEITRKLGEGGMASVYLASDIKHSRSVALKVLKPELAAVVGAERFLAEIRTTANLQHPHILPLFDSGEADSFLYYVMPYVEGETLRDRIDREKQLQVDEAVYIATAVANALQHAHERGVVHRDIKPANILMLEGEPMVADFGIAIAIGAAGGGRLTETGLSVGTPYYMSPEQATGDVSVGPASDVYALSCVLYEMLIGEPPYPGNTAQAVLGKIIQGVPVTPTAIRRSIPPNVDAAIRKALEKLPADRFTSAQEFAKALVDGSFRHGEAAGYAAAAHGGIWKTAALASSALALVLLGAVGWSIRRPEAPVRVERFSLLPTPGQQLSYEFAISDDGASIVYERQQGGVQDLVLRRIDNLVPTPIPGTQDAWGPEISPDGTEVAFFAGGSLRVTPLVGGVARSLADSAACCMRWGGDGYIYYSDQARTMRRVPAGGGTSEVVTTVDPAREGGDGVHGDLEVIPGADVGVFTVWGASSRIEGIRLSTGERRIITPGVKPFITEDGFLVFGSLAGELLAAPFDPEAMALSGPAVPFVEDVRVDGDDYPYYAVARNGALVYWTGLAATGGSGRAVRVSRDGTVAPIDSTWQFDPGLPEAALRLSPDGARLAVKITSDAGDDIWVKQLDDGPLSRLTFYDGIDRRPRWSADGRRIFFNSDRVSGGNHYDLWAQMADGTGSPEMLLDLEASILEVDMPPDESTYVLRLGGLAALTGVRDIVGLPVGDSVTIPLASEPYDEKAAALSPDGRWLAYESTETGRNEIYVRPFPDVDRGKWQVSTQGGINPRWARSGRELYYVDGDGYMIAADVGASSTSLSVASRERLFSVDDRSIVTAANYAVWDVGLEDGQFYMIQMRVAGEEGRLNEFVLVQNWGEELRARLGKN